MRSDRRDAERHDLLDFDDEDLPGAAVDSVFDLVVLAFPDEFGAEWRGCGEQPVHDVVTAAGQGDGQVLAVVQILEGDAVSDSDCAW